MNKEAIEQEIMELCIKHNIESVALLCDNGDVLWSMFNKNTEITQENVNKTLECLLCGIFQIISEQKIKFVNIQKKIDGKSIH